jgi:replication-associated recombination protein RarA
MNNELWITKYKPLKISDVIGNKKQITILKNYLNDKSLNKNKPIIISGNHGIGKTLTVKLILEEIGYEYGDLSFFLREMFSPPAHAGTSMSVRVLSPHTRAQQGAQQ